MSNASAVDVLPEYIQQLASKLWEVALTRIEMSGNEERYRNCLAKRRKPPRIVLATASRITDASVSGYYSGNRWVNKRGQILHEVAMLPHAVSNGLEQATDTMMHELAHYANHICEIRDTSDGGRYHNKFFKVTAELFGLICSKDDSLTEKTFGFNLTKCSPELLAEVKSWARDAGIDIKSLAFARLPSKKAPASLSKLQCKCSRIYATVSRVQGIKARCENCGELFKVVSKKKVD